MYDSELAGDREEAWEDFEVTGFAKGEFTYKLENITSLISEQPTAAQAKKYSDEFEIAGYSWKLLVFPSGNPSRSSASSPSVAVYLQSAEAQYLPTILRPHAKFNLILINHRDPSLNLSKEAEHRFTPKEDDWGFSDFIKVDRLRNAQEGFVLDDAVHIKVELNVQLEEKYTGATKRSTGYVGLKNQGATCYMNSLLQTLFHVPRFRKAVYQMPTEEDEEPQSSISLALKTLFYRLQHASIPVSTKDLIHSFGWTNTDAFQQHDVEELELKLCEKLEEKMKGTIVDKSIDALLKGKVYNYIECIDVEFKSTRLEEFLDIQLPIIGCKDVYDSFDKIVEVETMDADNKYHAEGLGLQDARKGVLLDSLPPILQLHLKRFDYDRQSWVPIKVNSRYEFYDEIDLSREDGKYFSPNFEAPDDQRYRLHSVLVHSGGSHGGHYYVYIRPDAKQWFKFDDEMVSKASDDEAIAQQFGGDDRGLGGTQPKIRSFSNAYMLVYVRLSDWDRMMCDVGEQHLEAHVLARLKAEQARKDEKRREKMQAHRFVTVKVVTDEDVAAHVLAEAFDVVKCDGARSAAVIEERVFKVDKCEPWGAVRERIAAATGVPPDRQRLWRLYSRPNGTFRPQQLLLTGPDDTPIKVTHRELLNKTQSASAQSTSYHRNPTRNQTTLKPIEVYVPRDAPADPSPAAATLLLVKLFDPAAEELTYVRSYTVTPDTQLNVIAKHAWETAGYKAPTQLIMFEEERTEPLLCKQLELSQTVEAAGLDAGDVLIVQPAPLITTAHQYPTVSEYFQHLVTLRRIAFRPLGAGADAPEHVIEVAKDAPYNEVTAALAEQIGLRDPALLRLTPCHRETGAPARKAVRHGEPFVAAHCPSPALTYAVAYETLDLPLPQVEQLLGMKLRVVKSNTEVHTAKLELRVPEDAPMSYLLEKARAALGPTFAGGRPLRIVKVYHSRVWELCEPGAKVARYDSNHWELRCEPVPDDDAAVVSRYGGAAPPAEGAAAPVDGAASPVFISHCSYAEGKVEPFGQPLVCMVAPDESLGSLQQRVQKRLNIPDEEFKDWVWGSVGESSADVQELQDRSVIVSDVIRRVAAEMKAVVQKPPFICMVHERRGYGGHQPSRGTYSPAEAQITLH